MFIIELVEFCRCLSSVKTSLQILLGGRVQAEAATVRY